jgi:uncharacterized protein YjbJ (UPF0337 family)
MKSSRKDIAGGRMHKVKGKVKESIGHLFGNRRLEAEGKDENLDGRVQEKIGKVEKVVGD